MTHHTIVTVVLCTCQRYDLLASTIDSILRQTYRAMELIVVDNSSDQEYALKFGNRFISNKNIRYVYEPIQGLSTARNRGVELANGHIIAFIDDDALASPNWIEELVAAFKKFPTAGYVGGKITPRFLAPRPGWLSDDLLDYLSIVDRGSETRELQSSEWVAGCNIAFEHNALRNAGGFPINLGRKGVGSALLSNEEIQICKRIRSAGKLAVYAPSATVEHLISADRMKYEWFLRRIAWQAISDFIMSPGVYRKASVFQTLRTGVVARLSRTRILQERMAELYDKTTQLLQKTPDLLGNLNLEDHDFLSETLGLRLE